MNTVKKRVRVARDWTIRQEIEELRAKRKEALRRLNVERFQQCGTAYRTKANIHNLLDSAHKLMLAGQYSSYAQGTMREFADSLPALVKSSYETKKREIVDYFTAQIAKREQELSKL